MKKFSAILICLLMIITCSFAGCAGFSIDKVKYYNDILAKVGDKNITRFDLFNAYNNYGYNYYASQMGESEKEALNSTLELLIQRESLYQYAINNNEYKPSKYEINEGIKEIYDSLDGQMKTLVNQAKNSLKIDVEDTTSSEEDTDTKYLRSDYTYKKRASVEVDSITYYTDSSKETESQTETKYFDVEYKIVYNVKPDEDPLKSEMVIEDYYLTNFTDKDIVKVIKDNYLTRFKNSLKDEEKADLIENKVLNLLSNNLINYEYYLRDNKNNRLSTKTDDLLYRYFERAYQSKLQEIYLENLREVYLQREANKIDINDLEEAYQYLYTSSRNKYLNNPASYKSAMTNASTSADKILYHNNLSDGTKFGYFIHTLLNFDDNTKAEIATLDKLKPYISTTEYETRYNSILANLKVKARSSETGLIIDKELTLDEVLLEYQDIIDEKDYDARLNMFIDFMFKYTGDTATLSQGMPYVVGNNGNSAMEQAFTDECLKLMDLGEGEVSTTTDCITSYGIHLVFYVGEVDKYDFNDPEAAYIGAKDLYYNSNNLYNTELNPLTNKTYFDMIFDIVYPANGEEVYTSNTGYSDFEQELIDETKVLRNTTKIKNTKVL